MDKAQEIKIQAIKIPEIKVKEVEPVWVAYIEGWGLVENLNRDIDELYRYLHQHNLQDKITGPSMGLFFTENGGRYQAAVPIKDEIEGGDIVKTERLSVIKYLSLFHNTGVENIGEY